MSRYGWFLIVLAGALAALLGLIMLLTGRSRSRPRAADNLASSLVALVEAKARACGVTPEQYLQGIDDGKYPPIHWCEVDEWTQYGHFG